MILCFFITTIPSSLTPILYVNHHSLDINYQIFRVCSAIIELSNYAVYIFIYLVCNTEFRKELLRVLQVSLSTFMLYLNLINYDNYDEINYDNFC